jgi:mono/diheme cytochrome c family protein
MTTRRLTAIACAALLAACGDGAPRIDAQDAKNVAAGEAVYVRHCAACHGAHLEGQPNWRRRLPNGRLPAPPHDASGHSWHHPDTLLFGIVKNGLVPPYAPAGYASDMPAFGGVLSDDQIRAVLAYIQSRWPKQVMEARAEMLRAQSR